MKTLVNFRDAGGFATLDGKQVKAGKIFRSGEICELSTDDKDKFVNQYGIKTIFDLRGPDEVAERPDDVFPGTTYINLDIMRDSEGQSSSLDDLQSATHSADQQMMTIYKEMILTESGQTGYQQFLETIASDEVPFIFHCFAGKDRTGIAAALVLGILDVAEEDIYHDYLLTNPMRKVANDQIVLQMRQNGMAEADIKEVEIMMYVKKDYLDAAFETMTSHYGGLLGFVKEGLGFPASFITDLKKLYTQ